jgi:TPR repeat protein
MAERATVIHNGHSYVVDLARFFDYSSQARQLWGEAAPRSLQASDQLDEFSFSLLIEACNSPQVTLTPKKVIPFLNASIVWSAPIFVEKSINYLIAEPDPNLITTALQLSASAGYPFHPLEKYVAGQIASYISKPAFAHLPAFLLMRILTWYSPVVPKTPDFVAFVVNALKHSGVSATFLLDFVSIQKIPPSDLSFLLSKRLIDLDFVGPKLVRECPDYGHQSAAKSAIANGRSEVTRLRTDYDSAKKRLAALQRQQKDAIARQKAAEEDQEDVDIEADSVSTQLESVKRHKEVALKGLDALKVERGKLEQQRESLRKQLEAAKQKQQAAAEALEMKKNRPPVTLAQKVIVANYRVSDFLAKIDTVDADLEIAPTELLVKELTDDENSRTVFLAYLWRNVALKDPAACCAYGTLLAMTDLLSDDLAAKLLIYAAEHGEPAAQFNIGVMARRGRGVRKSPEFVAESIVGAANVGYPKALEVVSKVCREVK